MPMTPEIISTDRLPPAQQLEAWRGWFSSIFEVEKPAEGRGGFLAESHFWSLDGLGVGRVSAPHLRATRTKALMRRDPVDHWCLTVGRSETGISMRNDSRAMPPLQPFLISLGDPVASERAADERLHLYLPRDSFAEIATQLDAARGVVLESGLARLLSDFMRNLVRTLPHLGAADRPQVSAAVRAMVGACVTPSAERIVLAAGQIDATRLDMIRRLVRRNIESPKLDAGMLCGGLGVSRTQLYRLLQGEGGVAHYIRRLRLEACHARLSDPTCGGTISGIAARLGFEDASQFSRAFRREFGATPGEIRAQAVAEGESVEAPGDDSVGIRPIRTLLQAL